MAKRVLITNDDGVNAPGIRVLAEAAAGAGLDVVVAAPDTEHSATGGALLATRDNGRVPVFRHPDWDGVPVYSTPASPAFQVLLAMVGAFGPKPDLVLSGINRGANVGRSVLHSGTLGAALAAAIHDVPAMALSLDVYGARFAAVLRTLREDPTAESRSIVDLFDNHGDPVTHWATAGTFLPPLLGLLDDLPDGAVVNVNIPDLPVDGLAGLRRAELAENGQVGAVLAEAEEGFLRTTVAPPDRPPAPTSDVALLAAGHPTYTYVRLGGV